jgi:hypothetical protein
VGLGLLRLVVALDIGNPEYTSNEQLRRLRIFVDAYALQDCSPPQIAAFVLARQVTLATWARGRGQLEIAEWAASTAAWTVRNLGERLLPTAFPQ